MHAASACVHRGACTSVDTLCSTSFGAKDYAGVGVWAQRGFLVLGLMCFVPLVFWGYTYEFFAAIGEDEGTARLSEQFVYILMPGIFPAVGFLVLTKWLIAQVREGRSGVLLHALLDVCYISFVGLGGAPGLVATPPEAAVVPRTRVCII